jgi:hypothetical protein
MVRRVTIGLSIYEQLPLREPGCFSQLSLSVVRFSVPDGPVLIIGVGMVPDRWYRVRIGRVRQWVRENASTDGEG